MYWLIENKPVGNPRRAMGVAFVRIVTAVVIMVNPPFYVTTAKRTRELRFRRRLLLAGFCVRASGTVEIKNVPHKCKTNTKRYFIEETYKKSVLRDRDCGINVINPDVIIIKEKKRRAKGSFWF